jgi:hypothetical protein
MDEEKKLIFIEILSYLVACRNDSLFNRDISSSSKNFKLANELWNTHFSDRKEDIFEVLRSSRSLYSQFTGMPIMNTISGSREFWGELLNKKD